MLFVVVDLGDENGGGGLSDKVHEGDLIADLLRWQADALEFAKDESDADMSKRAGQSDRIDVAVPVVRDLFDPEDVRFYGESVSVAAKTYELVAYGAVEVAVGGRVDELGRTEPFHCLLGLVEDRR